MIEEENCMDSLESKTRMLSSGTKLHSGRPLTVLAAAAAVVVVVVVVI